MKKRRIGSVVGLVGIRWLCDGERESIQETTEGILPLYQIARCWCIALYDPIVLACLRGHRLMSGNGLQIGDRVYAEQRG